MVESGRLEREGCCTRVLSPQNSGVSEISQYEPHGRYRRVNATVGLADGTAQAQFQGWKSRNRNIDARHRIDRPIRRRTVSAAGYGNGRPGTGGCGC